jgi:hypothetical protein
VEQQPVMIRLNDGSLPFRLKVNVESANSHEPCSDQSRDRTGAA